MRTGPKGIDPKHHYANVMVKVANENVVSHERVVSVNMTTIEEPVVLHGYQFQDQKPSLGLLV